MRLTITKLNTGSHRLLNEDGHWVGPWLGLFESSIDARNWARSNGYKVARAIEVAA